MNQEITAIKERYVRRNQLPKATSYSPLDPFIYMVQQEKERILIRWIKRAGICSLEEKRLLEIGCGGGGNLLKLLQLGFKPENLCGNELIEERALSARQILPTATQILVGDASSLDLPENSFDIVFQSTVFTSILNNGFQQKLADRMWSLVKPGGGVLWYDFTFNNPNNSDVRGVPVKRIRELFPYGVLKEWRLTLAPPIGRRVTRIHPCLYTLFNILPLLRTHVLCWINKTK